MKDVRISLRLTEDMLNELKVLAANRDVPVSQIIRDAIKYYFQEVVNNGN